MIQKIAARKVCLVLAILLVVSVVVSGCGQSNTVKAPKGTAHCAALTFDQLELVDGLTKQFIKWYNSVDISKPQPYEDFLDDDCGSYWKELTNYLEDTPIGGSAETTAIFKATSPITRAYEILRYDVETDDINDDMTFIVPEDSWQEVHDALIDVIDYFYD